MSRIDNSTEMDASPVLSRAVLRAAVALGLSRPALADILGLSRTTASRLYAGAYVFDPARKKEWEHALLFVRLFQSLGAVLGTAKTAKIWLTDESRALNARPAELLGTSEGLVRVVHYLDACRSRI